MKRMIVLLALIILASCASDRFYDSRSDIKKKSSYYNAIWLGKKNVPKPPH